MFSSVPRVGRLHGRKMRGVPSRVSLCALLVKIGLQQSVTAICQAETTRACGIARCERDPPPAETPACAAPRARAVVPRVSRRPSRRCSLLLGCAAPRSVFEPRYPSSILTVQRNRRRNPRPGTSVRPRNPPVLVFSRFSGVPGVARSTPASPPRRPRPDRRPGWWRRPSAPVPGRETASTSGNPHPGPGRAPRRSTGRTLPLSPRPRTLPYLTATLSSPTRHREPLRHLSGHIGRICALDQARARGARWQLGQLNDDRFMNASRTIAVPQRPQGRSRRP